MDRLKAHAVEMVSLRQSLFVLGRGIQASLKHVSSGIAPDSMARAEFTGLCCMVRTQLPRLVVLLERNCTGDLW